MLKTLRLSMLLVYFLFAALLGIIVCLFRPFNPDNTRICGRLFSWGGLRILGLRLEVEGDEYLKAGTPGVIIANHQSNFELFVHGAIVPSRAVSIGKASLKYLPLFGQAYWLSGNILIDRADQNQSKRTIAKVAQAITQQNTSVWIYPEGTRNPEAGILPFKKGAFHMAMNAKAPIIPICTSSYKQTINLNAWRSGTVIVRILPSVQTDTLDFKTMPAFIEDMHDNMARTIAELDARVERER